MQGDYEIRIGLLERTSDANNGGVVTSNGFDWSVAKNPLVLPSVNDPEAKDLPEWIENSKQNANFDSLKELTVNVFGDSYFAGNGLPKAQVWPALLATKYGWNYLNYGVNGNMLSGFGDADEMPMYKRYRQMSNNSPNLVILDGGRNDYNHNVPIGTIDSEDTNTFMGAMNVMMKGLRKKVPECGNGLYHGLLFPGHQQREHADLSPTTQRQPRRFARSGAFTASRHMIRRPPAWICGAKSSGRSTACSRTISAI